MPLWELKQNVSNSRQGKLRKINKWDIAYCSLISICQILWTFTDLYSVQRNFKCLISFNLCETSGRFLREASTCGRWLGTWGGLTFGFCYSWLSPAGPCFPGLTRQTQRTWEERRRSADTSHFFNAFGVHLSLEGCGHMILKESVANSWVRWWDSGQAISIPRRNPQMGYLCSRTPHWAGSNLVSSELASQLPVTSSASFLLTTPRGYPPGNPLYSFLPRSICFQRVSPWDKHDKTI